VQSLYLARSTQQLQVSVFFYLAYTHLSSFSVLGVMAELFCVSDINPQLMRDLFFIVTIITNVLATAAIAWRLLRLRRLLHQPIKTHDSVISRASGVIAILIESAALYAILGLVLIPIFWCGLPSAGVLGTVFTCLAVSAFMNHANITGTYHPVPQSCRRNSAHFLRRLDAWTHFNHASVPFYAEHIREGDGAGSRRVVFTIRSRHSYERQ
jgi:peptidoglycan biosynthesis protein MviN/MurJ (putative lipid II flippase)